MKLFVANEASDVGEQILVEIPFVLVQVSVYGLISYAMIGFEWTPAKFFWYLYVLFFGVITFTYYGMMMVALTPNATLATICASFFYALFNLFSGFLISKPVCPPQQLFPQTLLLCVVMDVEFLLKVIFKKVTHFFYFRKLGCMDCLTWVHLWPW